MTAINVIKQSNAVHMLTDGASWLPNRFGPACCKAWALPHLRAVVSGRGPRLGPMILADFLNCAGRSYDEMKRNATALAGQFAAAPRDASEELSIRAEFVIAGWSESNGPDAFVISRDGDDWMSKDTGAVMMAPGGVAIEQAVISALPVGVTCADAMDPARDGLAMVLAQRAARVVGEVTSVVGAFVQLTSITREGISTRILERWPEEWGDPAIPIVPSKSEASA